MPKITLRDLFAIVTIVALALGWWLDRSRLATQAEKDRARLARQAEKDRARILRLELDAQSLLEVYRDYASKLSDLEEGAAPENRRSAAKAREVVD